MIFLPLEKKIDLVVRQREGIPKQSDRRASEESDTKGASFDGCLRQPDWSKLTNISFDKSYNTH